MAMESRAIAGGRGGEVSHYADALPTSPVCAGMAQTSPDHGIRFIIEQYVQQLLDPVPLLS